MIDVSIIIVNYKTSILVCDAVKSIDSLTRGVSYEVIIVDNNSQDDSMQIITASLPRVKYVQSNENLGFGRANNKGLEYAQGRNILFLNPDTLLINDAISLLSNYLDNNKEVGAVGGNLYYEDLTPSHSHNMMKPSILSEFNDSTLQLFSKIIYGKNQYFNHNNLPLEVAFICGADMMVKAYVLKEVGGGFDPDFFMYYEETELASRIKKTGYKVVNFPEAKIVHLEGKSFSNSVSRETMSLTSRKLFFRKEYSAFYCDVADFLYKSAIIIGLIISYIFNLKNYKVKLKQRLHIFDQINRDEN